MRNHMNRRSLIIYWSKFVFCFGLPFMMNAQLYAQNSQPDHLYKLQSAFVDLRFGVMLHFNMGTFTNEEWASPNHDPGKFDPAKLDCDQWADACKAAGMTYGILTAKHHDGFSLWDTKFSDYDIANSLIKRDVVDEYVKAFRAKGLKPCLYFSIWDRHNGIENGGAKEEAFVMGQLTELLTSYGEIPMIIFDGWSWKMGHTLISFQKIYDHVKKLQPDCLIAEHNGNSNWQTDIIYYEGPKGVFPPGNNVYASQMALTITNGWFWHPDSPHNVKNLDFALDKLQRLEPLYCNFMLNVSPNRDGLFDDEVVKRLQEIGKIWKPDNNRLPLPSQPLVLRTCYEIKKITASGGEAIVSPKPPATIGSPVVAIIADKTEKVMIDGCIDVVGDRGGFSQTQTLWKFPATLPQSVMINLGEEKRISRFYYLPAQLMGYEGLITKYVLSAGTDGKNFTKLREDKWQKNVDMKVLAFDEVNARYVKLEIIEAIGRAMISEVGVGN
ncbi:MAG: alpha-L-fucosidase [Chitinophagaceae bacterium]|nr:alpha-L-fucosidase [Chitinophagaceae bacterium]